MNAVGRKFVPSVAMQSQCAICLHYGSSLHFAVSRAVYPAWSNLLKMNKAEDIKHVSPKMADQYEPLLLFVKYGCIFPAQYNGHGTSV